MTDLAQALRHSRVKLTWDEDDPERNRVTRRTLTKKEMEDGDFRAFIASGSESEVEQKAPRKGLERNKLRELLLGGGGDALPEGWGNSGFDAPGDGDDDVDMEVTFMPALSEKKDGEETTLEKYQRKMREKRKKRKEEWKEGQGERDESPAATEKTARKSKKAPKDDFFGESGSEGETDDAAATGKTKAKKSKKGEEVEEAKEKRPSTKEELSLVVTPDAIGNEPKHFDMKAVLRAEKAKKKKKGKRGKKGDDEDEGERELQEDFSINVKDDRFAAVHEDYTFAIDPSNPQCVINPARYLLTDAVCVASRKPSRWQH